MLAGTGAGADTRSLRGAGNVGMVSACSAQGQQVVTSFASAQSMAGAAW